MAREKRANRFLIDPLAILNDEAFQAMSLEARGAYLTLLLQLWFQKQPGRVLADDRILAGLSLAGDRWQEVKKSIRTAFKERAGKWVSPVMVDTFVAQSRFVRRQTEAGSRGGKAKRDNEQARLAIAKSGYTPAVAEAGSASGSVLSLPGVIPSPEAEVDRRLARSFRDGLIPEIQKAYPHRDVPLIARKLVEHQRGTDHPYKNLSKALWNWVGQAEERGSEPRMMDEKAKVAAWIAEGGGHDPAQENI